MSRFDRFEKYERVAVWLRTTGGLVATDADWHRPLTTEKIRAVFKAMQRAGLYSRSTYAWDTLAPRAIKAHWANMARRVS